MVCFTNHMHRCCRRMWVVVDMMHSMHTRYKHPAYRKYGKQYKSQHVAACAHDECA